MRNFGMGILALAVLGAMALLLGLLLDWAIHTFPERYLWIGLGFVMGLWVGAALWDMHRDRQDRERDQSRADALRRIAEREAAASMGPEAPAP